MALKVVFFGTAELACASLHALATDPRFEPVGVVTQPDKPRGRDLQVQPSAVKAAALPLKLPVLQPKRARDPQFIEEIRTFAPDVGVVVADGGENLIPAGDVEVPSGEADRLKRLGQPGHELFAQAPRRPHHQRLHHLSTTGFTMKPINTIIWVA